jgi:hypothetical protein
VRRQKSLNHDDETSRELTALLFGCTILETDVAKRIPFIDLGGSQRISRAREARHPGPAMASGNNGASPDAGRLHDCLPERT